VRNFGGLEVPLGDLLLRLGLLPHEPSVRDRVRKGEAVRRVLRRAKFELLDLMDYFRTLSSLDRDIYDMWAVQFTPMVETS